MSTPTLTGHSQPPFAVFLLEKAGEYRYFESGTDRIGFVYINQILEILAEWNPQPTPEESALAGRIFEEAREQRHFESGVDTIGFVYLPQLAQIVQTITNPSIQA